MPQISIDKHRNQQAGQQQQCYAKKDDEHSVRVPLGMMVLFVLHMTLLSMNGQRQVPLPDMIR